MAYEKRDGDFALFKNNRKANDKHPDSTGYVVIDGKEWALKGWTKTDKNGNKYVSGKIEEPWKGERVPGSAKTPIDINDEVPF